MILYIFKIIIKLIMTSSQFDPSSTSIWPQKPWTSPFYGSMNGPSLKTLVKQREIIPHVSHTIIYIGWNINNGLHTCNLFSTTLSLFREIILFPWPKLILIQTYCSTFMEALIWKSSKVMALRSPQTLMSQFCFVISTWLALAP